MTFLIWLNANAESLFVQVDPYLHKTEEKKHLDETDPIKIKSKCLDWP